MSYIPTKYYGIFWCIVPLLYTFLKDYVQLIDSPITNYHDETVTSSHANGDSIRHSPELMALYKRTVEVLWTETGHNILSGTYIVRVHLLSPSLQSAAG